MQGLVVAGIVALPERFPARSKASTERLCVVPHARFDAVPSVEVVFPVSTLST
jgi:antitoxin (DNA-binding transcriptional repressor) of toxin-antitoxin stability system